MIERSDADKVMISMSVNLMESLSVCHLTTVDTQGYPQTTAMLNLRCLKDYPSLKPVYDQAENECLLYLSTSIQSNKLARMQANPKVSVYFCEPQSILGCMLGGDVEIITDQDIKQKIWQDSWTLYYPGGPEGPEYGILKLVPKVLKGWCRNQPFEIQL